MEVELWEGSKSNGSATAGMAAGKLVVSAKQINNSCSAAPRDLCLYCLLSLLTWESGAL